KVGVSELDHFFVLFVVQGGGEGHFFHRLQIIDTAGQKDGGAASDDEEQGRGQNEDPPLFPHALPPQFPHQLEFFRLQTAPPFRFPQKNPIPLSVYGRRDPPVPDNKTHALRDTHGLCGHTILPSNPPLLVCTSFDENGFHQELYVIGRFSSLEQALEKVFCHWS